MRWPGRFPRRSERSLVLSGLLLVALLTPWTVPVQPLHVAESFGWQSPVSVIALGTLAVTTMQIFRRVHVAAATIAGLALLAWLLWVSSALLTVRFPHSGLRFLPIDLLGEGWYIALLALAVTVDGLAVTYSADERPARPTEVWPFALIPGAGLVRLHYPLRGRLWFLGVALAIFLLQTTAIGVEEFQYYASQGSLPPDRSRAAALIPALLALVLWILSLRDTHVRLQWEKVPDLPIRRPGPGGRSGA